MNTKTFENEPLRIEISQYVSDDPIDQWSLNSNLSIDLRKL